MFEKKKMKKEKKERREDWKNFNVNAIINKLLAFS